MLASAQRCRPPCWLCRRQFCGRALGSEQRPQQLVEPHDMQAKEATGEQHSAPSAVQCRLSSLGAALLALFTPQEHTAHAAAAAAAQQSVCSQRLRVCAAAHAGNGVHTDSRQRRVVVTGMGVVSCLGHDVDTFYDSLLQVRCEPAVASLHYSSPAHLWPARGCGARTLAWSAGIRSCVTACSRTASTLPAHPVEHQGKKVEAARGAWSRL